MGHIPQIQVKQRTYIHPQPFEEIIIFRLTTSSETISKSISRKADSGANQQFESSFSGSLDVNVTYDESYPGQGIIKGQYYFIKQTNIKSLMLSGHCKRIYFSYSFPKNKAYRVKHIIQNKNFANGQYFTFCGMYHRVGLLKQFHELSSKLF